MSYFHNKCPHCAGIIDTTTGRCEFCGQFIFMPVESINEELFKDLIKANLKLDLMNELLGVKEIKENAKEFIIGG